MKPRDKILAVLRGEILDEIPCYMEACMDKTVAEELYAGADGDSIQRAKVLDNCAVYYGMGFNQKTLSQSDVERVYQYETGAIWREVFSPNFSREAISYPVNTPEEALAYRLPSAKDPARINDAICRDTVQHLKDEGYYVQGQSVGVWQGIYYYLTSFENILEWMIDEPEAAHALFDEMKRYSLQAAERVIGWGVDEIFVASDFGTSISLMFSPKLFREYVFPWLQQLAELCHRNGVYCQLHSHGHIEDIMDQIVEAGVDIINPIGPSDHNDLAMFKQRWGDKIVLLGGISTKIAEMSNQEMEEHIKEVIRIGRKGGRFFPRTESGIPLMPKEKILFYVEALKKERENGYKA